MTEDERESIAIEQGTDIYPDYTKYTKDDYGIIESLKEVQLIREGKLKKKTWEQFKEELNGNVKIDCKYCQGNDTFQSEYNNECWFSIEIDKEWNESIILFFDNKTGREHYTRNIKYCPICGRKLL